MCLKTSTTKSTDDYLNKLKKLIENCENIVIGAGAGLSASAGLLYSGQRFESLFSDFIEKYNLKDMYSAAFYEHETLEELWGYWCKHIYYNRYETKLNSTYSDLFSLVKDKNYFVITTNCDHLFLKNNFDKKRLFYTQGDYGLFQCSTPCHNKTYQNEDMVLNMLKNLKDFKIPSNLIPRCPKCTQPMTVNLRKDSTFVEDDGWHKASDRYSEFLQKNEDILFLELGVGYNTPSIIKYPFWNMTYNRKNCQYACINIDDAKCPKEIIDKSICIEAGIHECLLKIK